MPGFTANRSYPYPVPTDAADVAGALQSLSEAVDTDVQALQGLVGIRPMARVRGLTAVPNAGSGSTFTDLPYELVDFNVGGAIAPLTGGPVQVLLEGLWLCVATFTYGPATGAGITELGADLTKGLSIDIGQVATHTFPVVPENLRRMDVSAATYIQPGIPASEVLTLVGYVSRSAGSAQVTFYDRSLTIMRMTEP